MRSYHPAKFAKIWIFLLCTFRNSNFRKFCWVIRTQPISVLKLFLLYLDENLGWKNNRTGMIIRKWRVCTWIFRNWHKSFNTATDHTSKQNKLNTISSFNYMLNDGNYLELVLRVVKSRTKKWSKQLEKKEMPFKYHTATCTYCTVCSEQIIIQNCKGQAKHTVILEYFDIKE